VDFQSKSTDVSFWRKKCKSLKNQLEKKKEERNYWKKLHDDLIKKRNKSSTFANQAVATISYSSKQTKPNNQFVLVSSILFDQKLALMRMSC
jgi:hypothetical protein